MPSRREMASCEPSKTTIAARIRSIREEMFGAADDGELAGRLGLPPETWLNYERGVTIPGDVLLHFLNLTGAEPLWLLEGRGARHRSMKPVATLI